MKLPRIDLSKSSAASGPRFPTWEGVAIFYIIIYGIASILGDRKSDKIAMLLGLNWGVYLWYGGLTIAALACVIGMILPSPNGLVTNLAGMMGIFLLAFSVGTGLALQAGTVFFSGNAGIWIFTLGGLLRSIQIFNQLSRLQRTLGNL